MVGDPLEGLLKFRSASPDPRLQPDPYALKEIVARLRDFRKVAPTLRIPEAFIDRSTADFIECFRRLDALPRDGSFWEGTNRRPTQYKMSAFSGKLVRDTPEDVLAHRMLAAVEVIFGFSFDPLVWAWLRAHDRADASGPVYAALSGVYGGYDTAPEIVTFLTREGLWDEARPILEDLTRAETPWVVEWAAGVHRSGARLGQ